MPRRLASSIAAAALCCLAFPAAAAADSADVTDADVTLGLAPDSSLQVAETLTFDYEGSYHASYRDIPLGSNEKMADITVSEGGRTFKQGGCTVEGCTDETGKVGVTNSPEGDVRIVWHHNASNQERTFVVSYRVIAKDHVIAYDDVIDVYWQVWGDQWDFDLDHLTASLRDPALRPHPPGEEASPENPSAVWGIPRDVEGQDFLEPGVARLEASDIPDHQFVELRVLVPRTPGQGVSAAGRGEGSGLGAVTGDEQARTEDYNSTFNKTKRWIADNSVLLAALVAALALGLLALFTFLAREHRTSTPEHLPEPPDDASPALAYGLAHEGGDSTDTVLATLLDLVERGYYEDKQATTEDEKLDLAIAVAAKRPSTEGLEPHEKEVLSFFDQLIEGETVPMSDMKDRIPEHDSTWRGRWESMTSALDSVEEGQLEWDRSFNGAKWLLWLGLIVVFGLICLADAVVNEDAHFLLPGAIGFVTLIVVMAWPGRRLKRLAAQPGERVANWRAFERWTEDFPRLKDDPPATLELWKRILIFGVAFGTAKRMIESGRIPAPVVASSGAAWSTYYFSGNATDFGSSFSSGFSSQVAPESSSGGGGGFSGGGGGEGRRRRRRVLVAARLRLQLRIDQIPAIAPPADLGREPDGHAPGL